MRERRLLNIAWIELDGIYTVEGGTKWTAKQDIALFVLCCTPWVQVIHNIFLDIIRQYHDCSPILQRPLRNKLQTTERYINRSSWYLFHNWRVGVGTLISLIFVPMFLAPFSRFRNFLFLRVPDVPFKWRVFLSSDTLTLTWYYFNNQVYTLLNFLLCSRGISYLSYFKNSRMYTPRYLKYLQFSEALFSMGSPCLKIFYQQKWDAICHVDHHALREITKSSNP